MSRCRLPAVAAILLSNLLAGCATPGTFPSLAPRPEELGQAPPPPPRPVPPPADPALGGQITRLLGDAREGDAKFKAAIPGTERAIRAAGKAGSDSWVEAQQALSRLETDRTQTTVAAADLNTLLRSKMDAPALAAQADIDAINAALDQVRALSDTQDQVLARLSAALPKA
jgi:ABC-type transporter Mla subunit MlaD